MTTLAQDRTGLVTALANPGEQEVADVDAWWRAANYLTIGQIYLQANPLLREPLRPEHIKPRLLGHWGTSPGLSFIYAHVSRLIRQTGQEALYLAGPGTAGRHWWPPGGRRARTARSIPRCRRTSRA